MSFLVAACFITLDNLHVYLLGKSLNMANCGNISLAAGILSILAVFTTVMLNANVGGV